MTLQLLSCRRFLSPLLTLQGSIDSRFFEGGPVAIGGGFLTLCSYRADARGPATSPSINCSDSSSDFLPNTRPDYNDGVDDCEVDLYFYWQPSEILTSISALFGIVLLQKKGETAMRDISSRLLRDSLNNVLMVANSLQLFYLLKWQPYTT